MAPKETIISHILQTQVPKNPFCCNPLFQKLFFLSFLKAKTFMLNKKTQIKIGRKQRQEEGIWRRKQDRKPNKEKGLMKKTFKFNNFMLFFSWNKTKEERKKNKKNKKNTRRKETKRDRERGSEKRGGQKKLRKNKGRHSIINKNALFKGEKHFSIKSKEKTKKEGPGPSEVAVRATSPDPYTFKKHQKNKKTKKRA